MSIVPPTVNKLEYYAIGKNGPLKGKTVRFFCQRLTSAPDGPFKAVVQGFGDTGWLDAEHPIVQEWIPTMDDFYRMVHGSKNFELIKDASSLQKIKASARYYEYADEDGSEEYED